MSLTIVPHTSGRVPGPGFYRMPAAVYHEDPAPEPSLSSSLIPMLAFGGSSPAHVWLKHPRLGKADEEDPEETKLSVGSVAHELLLGHGGGFEVVDAKAWTTKEAKAAREAAMDAGLVPIKIADFARAEAIADSIRAKIDEFEEARGLFTGAGHDQRSEVVGIFQCPVTGIWGRFMVDRWGPAPEQVWDVKTSLSALSEDFVQRQIDGGLGARAAWYLRGITTLAPELAGRVRFRWIFAEQRAPHEVVIREPDPSHIYVGDRQATVAALKFRKCLARNDWHGFERQILPAQTRPWAARDWRAREAYSLDLADVALELVAACSPFNTEAAGLPDDDDEIR